MIFTGNIRALDLDDTSALSAAYAVECQATRQVRPGWVPLAEGAQAAAWRASNGWTHELLGAFEDDRLLGIASSSTAHDTPDTTWVFVSVLPQHQLRTVGTQLVQAIEHTSPPQVRRFVSSAYRPTATAIESLVTNFAQPLGYARATTETVVELNLAEANLPAPPQVDGYAVSTYLNGVPDHLQHQVGVLKGLVDAEAPNGDLNWQPTPFSPQAYQEEIALWQRHGQTAVETIAVTAQGVVAAWTCLVVASEGTRPAQIQGTMVLTAHRGRSLGRVVKVASLLAARDHGRTARVRTSSDDQNIWMRAINDELGFVPVESEILLQKQRSHSPA